MPPYTQGLTIIQSGRETTKGTLVAATSKLAAESQFKVMPRDLVVRPKIIQGLLLANPGQELVTMRGVEWEIPPTELIYNQIQQLFAMAIKGGVTPTGAGPFIWTYTRDPTGNPTLDARTIEYRLTDGTTPSDWKFGYGMCRQLEISGAENEPLRYSARGFGRRLQTATLTAAQALPAFSSVPMALSTVYIDSTWAGRGTTQVSGQVLGWRFTIGSGAKPIAAADGRADLDFSIDVLDPDEVTIGIELVILATAGGQWATEKTAAEAQSLRAVEIRAVNGADSLKLQALCKHTAGSVFPDDVRDGVPIVPLRLEGSSDATNAFAAVLINGAATLG